MELSGNVTVPAEYSGFASASGTAVTVHGYTISIDARSLSGDLFPADLWTLKPEPARLERTQVNQLTLVPARSYRLIAGSGIVATFTYEVDRAGNVIVPPQYAGFASASGRTLTIRGYTIAIDGRRLSHDLLPAALWGYTGGFLRRTTVNRLTLIPATYSFHPGSGLGADMTYTLRVDGKITYPDDCEPFLDGRDTSTLVVGGYPLLVDASDADSDLAGIPDIAVRADTPRYLFAVLVPCQGYRPQTMNGVFMHGFNVGRNGAISFDASVAGRYVVTTVPRLEIHGTTPF